MVLVKLSRRIRIKFSYNNTEKNNQESELNSMNLKVEKNDYIEHGNSRQLL